MKRLIAFALCLAPAVAVAQEPPKRDLAPQPKLTVKQDGEDLVVTASVQTNGSDHVLLTGYHDLGKEVVLRYTIVQNSDRLVRGEAARSLKQVPVEWRVKKKNKAGTEFRVAGYVLMLSTAELEQLTKELPTLLRTPEAK